MNTEMINQLRHLGEATIYFTEKKVKTDELDLIVYQVLSDYLKKFGGLSSEKSHTYYEWLRCWSYTLLCLKEEEMQEKSDSRRVPEFEHFYKSFKKRTKQLSQEETLEILYRFPWHMRTMLFASLGQSMNAEFIHNVAGMKAIMQLSFPDVSYFAITEYDQWALTALHCYTDQETKLDYQMKKNISFLIYGLENYSIVYGEKYETLNAKNKHGMELLTDLMALADIHKVKENQFDLMLFAISGLAFWHFETNQVKSVWKVKKGPFEHLKRISRKIKLAL